jgi:hypothetical protein
MLNRITVVLFLSLVVPTVSLASAIQLPVTGQTGCWNASGVSVSCSGTGQDGARQAGKPWPSPRFTDNANGTVTDNMTGLVWLKDAGCLGTLTWQDAFTYAASLVGDGGQCGLSDNSAAGAWRVPNVNELESILGPSATDTAPPLPTPDPFTNVQSSYYWTSTTYAAGASPQYAWTLGMTAGQVVYLPGDKSGSLNLWPVRDAQ